MYTDKRQSIRMDFSEFGECAGEPFFVVMKNPRVLTYGEQQKIMETVKLDGGEKSRDGLRIIGAYISASNLTDITKPESDEPLDVRDPDFMDKIPGQIVNAIVQAYMPQKSQAEKN